MQDRTKPSQTPSKPVQSQSSDSDIIAGIIASLVDEENSTSRPPSYAPSYHPSFSWEPEDIERARRQSWDAISASGDTIDNASTYSRAKKSRPESDMHDSNPIDTRKHDSYSRPTSTWRKSRNKNADSAISLQPWKYRSGTTTPGTLNITSPISPPESPISPIDDVPIVENDPQTVPAYPSPLKTALIMLSLYISIFLVALDRTIIGPAIPQITNQFHSTSDIGWYGSAYMLTSCGFILLYGRIYTFFSTKIVFLSGILMFEAGSAICGASTSSLMLIIGRAVAGLGSSGIFTGAILIMLNTVPLAKRPMLQGLFGACFGVASVAGPLLGGAFTGSKLTWRWCFYINLPLGGFTVIVVLFFLRLEEQKPKLSSWMDTARSLDPIGTLLFLPSITCLLLALEWGAEHPWSSPYIIALLTAFAVLFCLFILWQYYTRHTTATIPARVLFQRSVLAGGASQFFVGATMLTVSIYIPLWFQAIKNDSAISSGIHTIPLVLSVVVGSISSGGLTQKIGYYTPFMILGSCLMAIGTGLLTTWDMHTATGSWVGYQIILGLGVGFTMQHPNLAIQVVLPKQDVATGTALLSLCQTLGGAVFVAVGQNVFIDKFTTALEHIGGLDPEKVVSSGATDLKHAVPLALLQRVFAAYNTSLTKGPFLAAVFVACLAVPAALGMEWRSVKVNASPEGPGLVDVETLLPDPGSEAERNISQRYSSQAVPQVELPQLPGPILLSRWLSKKVNPDLRENLEKRWM